MPCSVTMSVVRQGGAHGGSRRRGRDVTSSTRAAECDEGSSSGCDTPRSKSPGPRNDRGPAAPARDEGFAVARGRRGQDHDCSPGGERTHARASWFGARERVETLRVETRPLSVDLHESMSSLGLVAGSETSEHRAVFLARQETPTASAKAWACSGFFHESAERHEAFRDLTRVDAASSPQVRCGGCDRPRRRRIHRS